MSMTETNIPQSNKNMAMVIYILYIVGFFFLFPALIGATLAYINLNGADPIAKTHFKIQTKIFSRGFWTSIFLTFLIFFSIATPDWIMAYIGLAIIAVFWWGIWTISTIAKGITALNRSQPI